LRDELGGVPAVGDEYDGGSLLSMIPTIGLSLLRAIFRGREVGWTPFGPLAIRWSESLIGDHSGGARWLM
jgi:hypothetical protein